MTSSSSSSFIHQSSVCYCHFYEQRFWLKNFKLILLLFFANECEYAQCFSSFRHWHDWKCEKNFVVFCVCEKSRFLIWHYFQLNFFPFVCHRRQKILSLISLLVNFVSSVENFKSWQLKWMKRIPTESNCFLETESK